MRSRASHSFWFGLALVAAVGTRAPGQSSRARPPAILGSVLLPDRKPAPLASVHVRKSKPASATLPPLLAAMLPAGERDEEVVVQADAAGSFRFEADGESAYELFATQAPSRFSGVLFPVSAGDRVELVLAVGARFAGRVLAERDRGDPVPVEHATIECSFSVQSSAMVPIRMPHQTMKTESAADGSFVVEVPPGAKFSVQAFHGGRNSAPFRSGPVGPITLTIPARPKLRGLLVDRKTGRPVAGARVSMEPRNGPVVASTGEGRFELDLLYEAGRLLVHADGHERIWTWLLPEEEKGEREIRIELDAGTSLKGRLLRADGSALAGARFVFESPVRSVDRRDPMPVSETSEWIGRLGENGELRVGCLAPDTLVAGFVEVDGSFVQFYCGAPSVDVDLGEQKLAPRGSVEGTVLASDGTPLAAAAVCLRQEIPVRLTSSLGVAALNRFVLTDRSGRFSIRGLVPGEYQIAAAPIGHWFVAAGVSVGKSQSTVVLRVRDGAAIGGKVLGPDGSAFGGADIYFSLKKSDREAASFSIFGFRARSDASGHFALEGVPAGTEFHLGAVALLGGRKLESGHLGAAAGQTDLELELSGL